MPLVAAGRGHRPGRRPPGMPKKIHPSRQAMRGFDSFSFGDVRVPHPVNDTLTAEPDECVRSGLKGRWVLGLVDGVFRAIWQPDCGEQAPALIGDLPRHLGSFAPERSEGGVDVVAHQVKLVMAVAVG